MMEIQETFLRDCARMAAEITNARHAIAAEMRAFPTPFPACDVHFTRLTEERRRLQRLADGLEAFHAAARSEAPPLIHPRDTVFQANGEKIYHPAPS